MNKQAINKLSFFFMGIENKFKENSSTFLDITVEFTTGLKKFKGLAKLKENILSFNFNGRTNSFTIEQLIKNIIDESEHYESLLFTYNERGGGILIEASNKNVLFKNIDSKNSIDKDNSTSTTKTSTLLNRDYYVKVGEADALLKEIGIMSKDGKIKNDKIRKYNQIDHYVELLEGILDQLPSNEAINILDCGCGKSYLTFVLNYYLTEVKKRKCFFIGLDISETVINSSKEMAENLGYRNMEFRALDIKDYTPDKKIHVVISLHACDTATDMALALGIRVKSDVIIAVPCCHRELLNQYSYAPFKGVLKHGILKARMADVLTDGLRSLILEAYGYNVSVVEYISPLETPKNLMIRALKTKDFDSKILEEYLKLITDLNINPALYRFLNQW
ncbi:SAM-dependent methyltransferase [Clostridium sp. HMP27]|uniref:class I SAM-dependent methyltransferase n=1 Tax=Clostridium sp. HMP27 TaxID=1487921 RepID=UPI00052D5FA9|nr:SAM-dependent methyltransferase [Clostridium sp. HMP27]KGK86381.1 SAM-dependent methyltransferase [Clostridium sp. HMP27]